MRLLLLKARLKDVTNTGGQAKDYTRVSIVSFVEVVMLQSLHVYTQLNAFTTHTHKHIDA